MTAAGAAGAATPPGAAAGAATGAAAGRATGMNLLGLFRYWFSASCIMPIMPTVAAKSTGTGVQVLPGVKLPKYSNLNGSTCPGLDFIFFLSAS